MNTEIEIVERMTVHDGEDSTNITGTQVVATSGDRGMVQFHTDDGKMCIPLANHQWREVISGRVWSIGEPPALA